MVLVETKKLRIRDIAKILSAQSEEPCCLFGDAAVRIGICTHEEIQEALEYQQKNCPHVLDLAMEDERVDQKVLMQALRRYLRHAERLIDRMTDALVVV